MKNANILGVTSCMLVWQSPALAPRDAGALVLAPAPQRRGIRSDLPLNEVPVFARRLRPRASWASAGGIFNPALRNSPKERKPCPPSGAAPPGLVDSAEDAPPTTPPQDAIPVEAADTVLLDVREMMCGGCAAAVRQILLDQPGVLSASVNLVTETAFAKLSPAGVAELRAAGSAGEQKEGVVSPRALELAAALTDAGFPSDVRRPDEGDDDAAQRRATMLLRKKEAVAKAWADVAVASALAALCCAHHAGHLLHLAGFHQLAHGPVMSLLDDVRLKVAIALSALLGPARDLVADGFRAFLRRAPNMNSLVALASLTAFSTGVVGQFYPELNLDSSFIDEPVMLLAVVLLGRSLEASVRAEASSDLQALLSVLPARARLLMEGVGEGDGASTEGRSGLSLSTAATVEVPASSIRAGESVLVLPGDTVPVDGVVVAGMSAVDESMQTGESLTAPKRPGDAVLAGTVNWEGPLAVEATATGANCSVCLLARKVEEAQERAAPVQRLADAIAGPFVFSIIAAAAATFAFWQGLGPALFPDVLLLDTPGDDSGSPLVLATTLATSVLVVACPCALGLATPTAILVGTSLGAKRGLLLRGGDVLERLAHVQAVVFDKTGTLTLGRPRVTGTSPLQAGGETSADSREGVTLAEQAALVQLAASVEASTLHPVATAIVSHAEENRIPLLPLELPMTVPGRGVAATVGGRRIAVGAPQWVESLCGGERLEGGERCAVASAPSLVAAPDSGSPGNLQPGSRRPRPPPAPGPACTPASSSSAPINRRNGIQRSGQSGRHGVAATPSSLTDTGLPDCAHGVAGAAPLRGAATGCGCGGRADEGAQTWVYVGEVGVGLLGSITVEDEVRPEAAAVVRWLHDQGVSLRILSGDDDSVVKQVARRIGVPEADAQGRMLPEDKAAAVSRLQEEGLRVAMVGDGLNDSLALAVADVGVAVPRQDQASAAMNAAADVASLVLLHDSLSQLPEAILLAREALGRAHANLLWALAYNAVAVPVAAGALLPHWHLALTPAIAGALMAGSSLFVVLSSVALRLYNPPPIAAIPSRVKLHSKHHGYS